MTYPSQLSLGSGKVSSSGAWKTSFVQCSSPDGMPLHVVMLQITLEGDVLRCDD